MAWTTPRTWVTSEVVSASIMNTHVRDNFNATAPALVSAAGQTIWSTAANALAAVPAALVVASDISYTSNTTLANVAGMSWAVGANEIWAFIGLWEVDHGAGGFKFQWTLPASGTIKQMVQGNGTTAGSLSSYQPHFMAWSISNPVATLPGGTGAVDEVVQIAGWYYGGGTAGTVQLQAAQSASSGTASTFKKGSDVMLQRLV